MPDLTLPMAPLSAPKVPTLVGGDTDLGAHPESPRFHDVADAAVRALRNHEDRRPATERPASDRPGSRSAARAERRATTERRDAEHRAGEARADSTPKTTTDRADDSAASTDAAGDDAANPDVDLTTPTATTDATSTDNAASLPPAALATPALAAALAGLTADATPTTDQGATDATGTAVAVTATVSAATSTATDTAPTVAPSPTAATTGAKPTAAATTTAATSAPVTETATTTGPTATTSTAAVAGPATTEQDAAPDPDAKQLDPGVEHAPNMATPVLRPVVTTTTPTVDAGSAVSAAGGVHSTSASTSAAPAASAAAASTARLDAAEQAETNANAIRVVNGARMLRRNANGPSTMTITLEPAHLGQVRIDMTLQNGALSVRLTAEHGAGAQTLQKALPTLQSELEADGLHLSDLGVGLGNGSGAHGEQAAASHDARRQAAGPDGGDASGLAGRSGRRNRGLDPATARRSTHNSRFDLDL